jgi:hypothetical protein
MPATGFRERARPGRGRRAEVSYLHVLAMISGTYLVALLAHREWLVPVLLAAQTGTVWQVLRISGARRWLRVAAGGVFTLGLVASGVRLGGDADLLTAVVFLAASALYLIAPFAIVRDIGARRGVDSETMFGALAAYLLLGMAFGFVYGCLGVLQQSPFFGESGDGTLSRALFFSFVTLTTTGYGDLVPAGNPGQTIAVLEALTGQLFLVTALAKVVDAWHPRGWRSSDQDEDRP